MALWQSVDTLAEIMSNNITKTVELTLDPLAQVPKNFPPSQHLFHCRKQRHRRISGLLCLPYLCVAAVVENYAWSWAMPRSSWGTKRHGCATVSQIAEWLQTTPSHSSLTQTKPDGTWQLRVGLDSLAVPVDRKESRKCSCPLHLSVVYRHLLGVPTGQSWQSHRSRQTYSDQPGGSRVAGMTQGLFCQTCSGYLTVEIKCVS